MAASHAPNLARWIRANVKLVTFSFFLGFGLSACSGDESPDEPVAIQDTQAADDAAAASDAAPEQASAEAPSGDEAAPKDPVAEAAAPEADKPAADSDAAVVAAADAAEAAEGAPSEQAVDKPTDTVKAELTADQNAVDPNAGQTVAAAEPEPAAAPMAAPMGMGMGMGMNDGGTVSSPGAAKFVKGKHDHGSYAHTNGYAAPSGDGPAYVVQRGDTLASIAAKIYGGKGNWHTLAEMNGMNAPYVIFPGDEVHYDSSVGHAKSFAKNYRHHMKTIVVQHGDTLCSLAQEIFGSQYAWKMLLSYNKGHISNPNHIAVGMHLSYVADAAMTARATPKAKTDDDDAPLSSADSAAALAPQVAAKPAPEAHTVAAKPVAAKAIPASATVDMSADDDAAPAAAAPKAAAPAAKAPAEDATESAKDVTDDGMDTKDAAGPATKEHAASEDGAAANAASDDEPAMPAKKATPAAKAGKDGEDTGLSAEDLGE